MTQWAQVSGRHPVGLLTRKDIISSEVMLATELCLWAQACSASLCLAYTMVPDDVCSKHMSLKFSERMIMAGLGLSSCIMQSLHKACGTEGTSQWPNLQC